MVPPWVSIGVKSSPKEVSSEALGGAVVFNTGSGAHGGAVLLNYSNMVSNTGVCCCLFRRELSESSAFKKRKLFHGKQCKEAKKFLNEVILEEFRLSVNSFEETIN